MQKNEFPKDSSLFNLNGVYKIKYNKLSRNEKQNKYSFDDIAFIEITRDIIMIILWYSRILKRRENII